MPELPKVIPILEYAAGVTSAEPRAEGGGRLGGQGRILSSGPATIDMPTHQPGDNTIDPGGAIPAFT